MVRINPDDENIKYGIIGSSEGWERGCIVFSERIIACI
jgi:hypothetical protein